MSKDKDIEDIIAKGIAKKYGLFIFMILTIIGVATFTGLLIAK